MSADKIGYTLLAFGCCIWPLIFHGLIVWFSRRTRGLRSFLPNFIERLLQ